MPLSQSPDPTPPRRSIFRRLTATLAVVGLTLVAVVGVPATAQAAPNSGIAVGNVTIAPADQQATLGDTLTVSGEWDASNADPQAGDTFTIGLPPEFSFPQTVPFQLMGADANGNPVVWGNCLTDPATGAASCELTSAVTATPEIVMGTWQFQVEAVKTTTEEEVVFDLNGTSVPVELPGSGGIDDGIDLPSEVTKSGVMNQNNWSMTWTVDVPGANMAGQDTVTLRDTLGAGHQLCSPTDLKVEAVRGTSVTDVTALVTTAPEPGATDFTIGLTAPSGGFDANVTYRVTYQTCTPDGQIDPAGTVYDNSAQIEGWGVNGIGVGEVENHSWQTGVSKSGSVLGGADRNGKIAWTVVIPGDQMFDDQMRSKKSFTLTETLGAGHNVCADTINGIQVTERYGPSDQLQRNLTGMLTPTTISSSAQAFTVRFDVSDPALVFKPSDYRYVITYTTCVTSDDLSAGGTDFSNTVDVDGEVTTGEATVPDRNQGKTGRINTSTVTLDSVPHMPQTTLDWTITIPGEKIEGINDLLTLTDTLSATQTVCAAGDPSDGLAARLRLNVEARDQIQDGGLATVDLNDVTAVSDGESTISFNIDATDLPIPTGTSSGFTREYQYVISYTTCTASGGMDAPGTVYDNAVSGSGISFTTTSTQNNSGSGTGQGVTRGSVSIDKVLADTPGAALVPSDASFTVHVKEIDPTNTVRNEYELQIPLNGAPVSGLNARGTGWTVELTEPMFPTISGVTFGAPVFSASAGVTVSEDGSTATAAITPGTNVSVTLTNEAQLGSVTVSKTVQGGAAGLVDEGRTYQLSASIDTSALGANVPAEPDRTYTLTVGEPVVVDELPIGSTVTFTEARPADDDTLTWGAPVISPSTVVVTAELASTPAVVSVVNSVERSVGTFSLVKNVTGDQSANAAVPDTVTVSASWNENGTPESKTLTVPTDGTPVPFGENLLIGTAVTLTETTLADGSSIAWGAPVWSGTGVTVAGLSSVVSIGRDAEATVNLENRATTSTAGISLIKGLAGEAAGEVDRTTEFPVTATWTDAAGDTQTRQLTINAVEPTPLGVELPAGTVVTITEGTQPGFDTVVWKSITIAGNGVTDGGDGSATVVVSDQQGATNLVTVINEATWAPGTFSLTKSIVGILLNDAEVPDSVTVIATWTDGDDEQTAEISVPTDGTAVKFPQQLPHGTEVTLTEAAVENSARYTWATPEWSGERVAVAEDGTVIVTIGAADVAEIALVNTAVASLGSLSLTKSLTGDGATTAAATVFPVTLTWTDLLGAQQTRDVELVAGRVEVVADVPLGTAVRVEEHAAKLADRVRWAGADWSSSQANVAVTTESGSATAVITVTGAPGETAAVTLQNDLVVTPALAITGANAAAMLTLAGSALIAMLVGVLLIRARRQKRA